MPEKKKQNQPARKLTPAQWSEIVAKWELGTHTLDDLSREYGVTREALRQGLNNRGVKRASRAHEIAEATVEAAKSERQRIADEAARMKTKYLKYTDIITQITMRKVTEQVQKNRAMGEIRLDLDALQKAANILSKMRDENYHLLGLHKDDVEDPDLPEIILTEFTPEELDQIQRAFDEHGGAVLDADVKSVSDDDDDLPHDPDLPFDEDEEEDDA